MSYTWEEYQQFIEDTPSLEESLGDLKMYHYYDTLENNWMYAIVLCNKILYDTEDYPHDFWNGVKAIYELLKVNRK